MSPGDQLAAHRPKIIVVMTLILTWIVASLLPHYQTTIRTRVVTAIREHIVPMIPTVKIDYHPNRDPRTAYNASKLAMLIESRPYPHLAPQILHMISVVPPDWRFLFLGSNSSIRAISHSMPLQYQVASGKLDVLLAPKPWAVELYEEDEVEECGFGGQGMRDREAINRMMTDLRFYDAVMPDVEWLLRFEADSIMCANSDQDLNDWLHLSWAGAPRWPDDQFAHNGGLSLRRVSAIRQILAFQGRYNDTGSEDEWFGERVGLLPAARVATPSDERHFSVEDVFYDRPMGYHVRAGGTDLSPDVWDDDDQRKAIWEHCPELSMIMPMKLVRQKCPEGDTTGNVQYEGHEDD